MDKVDGWVTIRLSQESIFVLACFQLGRLISADLELNTDEQIKYIDSISALTDLMTDETKNDYKNIYKDFELKKDKFKEKGSEIVDRFISELENL
jgi:hypothetical protein